ncbi:MAG: ethanolamine ammonia-lyase light chain EutC, partial [Bryobacteraceae bacterium]
MPVPAPDKWAHLRRLTSARIALGHAGNALPTTEILNFRLQHAQA